MGGAPELSASLLRGGAIHDGFYRVLRSRVWEGAGDGRVCNGVQRQMEVAGQGRGHQDFDPGDSQQRGNLVEWRVQDL